MKKSKKNQKQPKVLEYRIAIRKNKNNIFVFILDFIFLAAIVAGLYLGFTHFGTTLEEYEANQMLRFAGLGVLGAGFILAYIFSLIFHKAKNSQDLRDRAWTFLVAAIGYFAYMAVFYLFVIDFDEPIITLLPAFLLVIPPFLIAFLAGRGHPTLIGGLSHLALITAYLYATFRFNYIATLTQYHNVLLLANSDEACLDMLTMVHDWVLVASLIGTSHFLFMRNKYQGWQNFVYVLSGFVSLAHAVIFIILDVMFLMANDMDFQCILGERLIPAVAAAFSLIFALVQFFCRDLEKKRAMPFFTFLVPLLFAGIFFALTWFGLPMLFSLSILPDEDMYIYLSYGLTIYGLALAAYFLFMALNVILRADDQKWALNKKALVPAENRAVFFSGKGKPNSGFIAWSKGEPNRVSSDNRHLFAVETPEDFSDDAKKQIFLRYILALVDVNKRDYRLLYMGKVYFASPDRIDPQTGRPVVSLESDARGVKFTEIPKEKEEPKKKKEPKKAAPKEEEKKEEAPIPPAPVGKTLAPAPKEEVVEEEKEESDEAKIIGPNRIAVPKKKKVEEEE